MVKRVLDLTNFLCVVAVHIIISCIGTLYFLCVVAAHVVFLYFPVSCSGPSNNILH